MPSYAAFTNWARNEKKIMINDAIAAGRVDDAGGKGAKNQSGVFATRDVEVS